MDLIDRQATIDVICQSWCGCQNSDCKHHFDPHVDEYYWCDGCSDVEELKNIPSAEPEYDLDGYSSRLWKAAYERGKQDAEPEPQWIPCSNRLPEKNGWYQVTLKDGRVSRLYYDYKSDRWIDNVRKYMFELYDIYSKTTHKRITKEKEDVYWDDWVIAWMPMPEPYREDENNATDRR